MTGARLLFRSLVHFWRIHVAVLLGVTAATAVIGGALIVGDSVRDSLRQMSLDRLGGVDHALVSQQFFTQDLTERFTLPSVGTAAPAIVIPGSMSHDRDGQRLRAGHVQVIGIDERFWSMMHTGGIERPTGEGVVLSRRLAEAVHVGAGDSVELVVEIPASIPRDSLLGDRNETVTACTLTVSAIAPDQTTPGRFGLNPAQQLPANAFVELDLLQRQLGLQYQPVSRRNPSEKPARVNALFVAGSDAARDDPLWLHEVLADSLSTALGEHATLADYSLGLVRHAERGYLSLESAQMILPDEVAGRVHAVLTDAVDVVEHVEPVLVSLLNELWNPDDPAKFSMYSVVAGIPFSEDEPFGPFEYIDGGPPEADGGPGAPVPVVLTDWLAEDLDVQVGDTIAAKYHLVGDRGELPELEQPLVVTGIVTLSGAAADRGFTPHVEGITDADTFRDWRQPFPMDLARVTRRDEAFWERYKSTPKLFMTRGSAVRLFRSRYGTTTSLRIAPFEDATLDELEKTVEREVLDILSVRHVTEDVVSSVRNVISGRYLNATSTALELQPVKWQGLQAAAGTTDFTGLFIGFSVFLIAAAILLINLLFRLGIERRMGELGLLAAVGWSPQQVRRQLLLEGALLTLLGGAAGCLAAIGYARLMVYGLKTWWIGAIGTKFLFVSVRPTAVASGFLMAVVVAVLAIRWALRLSQSLSTHEMLTGVTEPEVPVSEVSRRSRRAAIAGLICAAVGVGLLAATLLGLVPGTEAFGGLNWPVVTFFVVGIALLAASQWLLSWWLDAAPGAGARFLLAHAPLGALSLRNAARNRSRTVLTASLMAAATFVIVAVAAGRQDPTSEVPRPRSGNGGFTLVAESSSPILYDLNTEAGRAAAGIDLPADAPARRLLEAMRVRPFRVQPGEDASCLNLYQTHLPTILGVPEDVLQDLIGSDRFVFADARVPEPWALLTATFPDGPDGPVPVVGDTNTLMYSLHKGLGATIGVPHEEDAQHILSVAGMLSGSIFQGVLLMSEANFRRLFPQRVGFQYFLITIDPAEAPQLAAVLESVLGDYGFDVEPVAARLADFLAVQNTYLSTFQTLGGLGLWLGTLGLATVMLRNVLDRRRELALLRAVGFRDGQVARLVLGENAFILLWGLLSGTASALLAMMPHLRSSGADVPWGTLFALLIGVFLAGMVAALVAVHAAARMPLLKTLQAE
jgi:ABC-type antimicrobial peptide transport system permease subunit